MNLDARCVWLRLAANLVILDKNSQFLLLSVVMAAEIFSSVFSVRIHMLVVGCF